MSSIDTNHYMTFSFLACNGVQSKTCCGTSVWPLSQLALLHLSLYKLVSQLTSQTVRSILGFWFGKVMMVMLIMMRHAIGVKGAPNKKMYIYILRAVRGKRIQHPGKKTRTRNCGWAGKKIPEKVTMSMDELKEPKDYHIGKADHLALCQRQAGGYKLAAWCVQSSALTQRR